MFRMKHAGDMEPALPCLHQVDPHGLDIIVIKGNKSAQVLEHLHPLQFLTMCGKFLLESLNVYRRGRCAVASLPQDPGTNMSPHGSGGTVSTSPGSHNACILVGSQP